MRGQPEKKLGMPQAGHEKEGRTRMARKMAARTEQLERDNNGRTAIMVK